MGVLRLFLATVVLLFHSPDGILQRVLHPALAVQCFYCISGFYIQLLVYEFSKKQGNWKIDFYKSRILRIFPVYYIFLFATAIATGALVSHWTADSPSYFLLFSFNNLFIFSQDILRLTGFSGHTLLGQSWTLAIELMFYCVAPFLLTKRNSLIVLFILASICCRLTLNTYDLNYDSWFYGFFPSEIGIFLLGSLAYRFYTHFLQHTDIWTTFAIQYLGFIALAYLLYFDYQGWNNIAMISGGTWGGAEGAGAPYRYWVVLFLTIVCLPFIFKMSKHSRLDRFIGELSYPLYMGHLFVLFLIADRIPLQYQSLAALIITLVLSILIVHFIEIPLRRYRALFRKVEVVEVDLQDAALQESQ